MVIVSCFSWVFKLGCHNVVSDGWLCLVVAAFLYNIGVKSLDFWMGLWIFSCIESRFVRGLSRRLR